MCLEYRVSPVFVAEKSMKHIKLSNRLLALAELIDDGASVADVGTDHGYLPIYLAQTGKAKRIIASDISASSLETARRHAIKNNVADRIKFLVTSGLDGISKDEVDTIVIAGMGGETIISVLKSTHWIKQSICKLILQPQSKIDLLFKFLYDNEYLIKQTIRVNDNKKLYTVIEAKNRGDIIDEKT